MTHCPPSAAKAQATRDPALVDTRISGREQRPRTLAGPSGSPAPGSPLTRSRARYLSRLGERAAAAEREQRQPAYIRSCFANPQRERTYWIYTWKPDNPADKTRVPYVCGSWRCEYCQQHAGHVLYSRLQEAFDGIRPDAVVFAVLTLDPSLHRVGAHDLASLYSEFSRRQNRWLKRLRRWMVTRYGYAVDNQWASVTECHKSGVPHVNIVIHHPEWARELRETRAAGLELGLSEFEATRLSTELEGHARACGFGWRCTAEANRYGNTEAISGYLVKGVKRADAMHGELAKLSQLPLMAPKNFRRLRAGKGFIPPPHKGKCTGTVIRRYYTPEGDEQTEPLSKPVFRDLPEDATPEQAAAWDAERRRKLAYLAEVQHCREIEQSLAWRDEGFRGREARAPVGTTREELVERFTRGTDGATRAGRLVVLDAPRPKARPPDALSVGPPAPTQLSWLAVDDPGARPTHGLRPLE